jgi:hypothetical protein
MIERLKQAFTLAEQCSDAEQEALADLLLERLAGEALAEDEHQTASE